jgi:hypothetical protein
LAHGYTNSTRRIGSGLVGKRYLGPDRHERWRREQLCLSALRELLPVPVVVRSDAGGPSLVLTDLPGRPGQELIDAGHGEAVKTSRMAFQEAIESTFIAVVERAVGRRVVAFVSHVHLDPLFTVELFRLAPQDGSGG